MSRVNLIEIANNAIKGINQAYVSNSFKALANGDASEVQSICIQVVEEDDELRDKTIDRVRVYLIDEVRKGVGEELVPYTIGNGCTVYALTDAGVSLNVYDTDFGFWATLVYNLD